MEGPKELVLSINYTTTVTQEQLDRYELEVDSAGYIGWRKDSRDHPRNWSFWRKTYDISLVTVLEFYTTVISTSGPYAAKQSQDDFGYERITLLVTFGLVYQIGQALGGMVIPPASDLFGRKKPYVISSIIFSLSCLIVGITPHLSAVVIGRFISGVASAVPTVVVSGSIEDQFDSRQRVWIVLFWNVLATSALAFGPVYAACIGNWRWIFYSAAAGTAVLTLMLFGIRESRPSMLLKRKIAKIAKEAPNAELPFRTADPSVSLASFIDVVFIRSTRMMFTEPILVTVAAMSAVSWGIVYLFTESSQGAFVGLGVSESWSSFPMLAIIIGAAFGIIPQLWDSRMLDMKKKKGIPIEPEDKIMGFAYGTPVLAVGLWWFYGTTPPSLSSSPWILPTVPMAFIGFGVNEIAYTMSSYLTDTYTVYAVSGFSGLSFVRATVSGIMPLIGYIVFEQSSSLIPGYVLAAIATLFCLVPFVFFKTGKALRQRSPFAKYSVEMSMQTQVGDG